MEGIEIKEIEVAILGKIDEQETVDFLKTLIQRPSFTHRYLGVDWSNDQPLGDCREVAQVCASKLDEARIPYRILAAHENLPNIAATIEGESEKPVLLFHAHMDTVPVGDVLAWKYDPFAGEMVDGVIYGRGAGDCKGSVAAQIMAAKAIVASGVNLGGTLLVAVVADEEAGGRRGTKWLHDCGYLQADFLIVGEQTKNQVAIAERSAVWVELVVHGKAAHGALPWEGDNAIVKMARLICLMQDELVLRLQEKVHAHLPHSSLNIGTIEGGIKPNMVPDVCRIKIDRRILHGESRETVLAEIREVLDEFSRSVEPISYQLNVLMDDSSMPVNTSASDDFVQIMQGAIRDVTGEERELTGYFQGSDARFFSKDGIPIAIFGPTDPVLGHSPNEHISVKELHEAAQILGLTAVRVLGITS